MRDRRDQEQGISEKFTHAGERLGLDSPNVCAANGGDFAAWEQPELFAAELRAAFRSLR
jgi:hypothetical protein